MSFIRRVVIVCTALAALAGVGLPATAGDADPEPATPEWIARDLDNQAYAHGRLVDAYSNPALGQFFWTETVAQYSANAVDQLHHPDRPEVTLGDKVPGGSTADPYRHHWERDGRGVRVEIEFTNRHGARMTGNLWAPNLDVDRGPFPGIVITTGSIQGYEELYWWAAQGLAEAGYVVMTYDVQGQGQSETFGHHPDGSLWCDQSECPGVPFQQAENFVGGTEDALAWFLSGANPLRDLVDETRLGLAGHSLGASAVTEVGNRPGSNIDAVVAWDNANLPADQAPLVPTMGQNAEYFFNTTPTFDAPDEDAGTSTFRRFEAAGVDAMQVALRGSTHLEWTWVPYILPASSEGERVAMYYTRAWFDRYLYPTERGTEATARLTAAAFDGSADASAIGAGAWDPETNSNVPHTIGGDTVADHLSFYYRSSYAFSGADSTPQTCQDMRAGC